MRLGRWALPGTLDRRARDREPERGGELRACARSTAVPVTRRSDRLQVARARDGGDAAQSGEPAGERQAEDDRGRVAVEARAAERRASGNASASIASAGTVARAATGASGARAGQHRERNAEVSAGELGAGEIERAEREPLGARRAGVAAPPPLGREQVAPAPRRREPLDRRRDARLVERRRERRVPPCESDAATTSAAPSFRTVARSKRGSSRWPAGDGAADMMVDSLN